MTKKTEFSRLLQSLRRSANPKPLTSHALNSRLRVIWECKENHECKEGHKWVISIGSGFRNYYTYPHCSGNRAWSGYNDLKTLYPEIAAQWHPDKNGNLKPEDFTPGSKQSIIWLCSNSHFWEASIKSRIYYSLGCPYCSGRRAWAGYNDLKTLYPEIAAQWHPDKNGEIKPENVTPGSHKTIVWRCSKGHEWPAKVYHRVKNRNCPFCSHRSRVPYENSDNSLAHMFPMIAAEWDYERNISNPNEIYAYSNQFTAWKCLRGHRWNSIINSRTRSNRPGKCPYCAGKRAIQGENDLATVFPDLIKEWDFVNNTIDPSKILPYSHKTVWWVCCSEGHHFPMKIANRSNGEGCPICSKNRH